MMLPNHTPLKVAETFRVLEALHPGRVDLGIGRAPGTDPLTALALRRSRELLGADDFPARLNDLLTFLDHGFPQGHPLERIRAMPDDVPMPEVWLLGSSDFSAELSAQMGLRFAFAHHIAPWPAIGALRLYREHFQPSEFLAQPQGMIGVSVVCAETEARAEELSRPLALTLLRFRSGKMARFPSIEEATNYKFSPEELQIVEMNRDRSFVGTPKKVPRGAHRPRRAVPRERNHGHHNDPRARRPPPLLRAPRRILRPRPDFVRGQPAAADSLGTPLQHARASPCGKQRRQAAALHMTVALGECPLKS